MNCRLKSAPARNPGMLNVQNIRLLLKLFKKSNTCRHKERLAGSLSLSYNFYLLFTYLPIFKSIGRNLRSIRRAINAVNLVKYF